MDAETERQLRELMAPVATTRHPKLSELWEAIKAIHPGSNKERWKDAQRLQRKMRAEARKRAATSVATAKKQSPRPHCDPWYKKA